MLPTMREMIANPELKQEVIKLHGERPWLCKPFGSVTSCCEIADEVDEVKCSVCGRVWTESCSFDDDYA